MRKQHSMGYTSQQKNDRGFYIILAVCLVVIVVSGYVLFFAPGAAQTGGMDETVYTPTDTELTDGTAVVVLPDVDVPVQPVGEPEAQRKPETEPPEESETGAASASDVPAAAPVEPVEPIWVRPVAGGVVKAFSGDTLVRDETLGDWRVHAGTDYAAEAGARVYAVSDGTVRTVETGTLYGTCVTITLTDGRTAVYRGLDEKVKVKTDSRVRAGDVIGTVGTKNAAEAAQSAHIHLELYEADETIDPEAVLGGKTGDGGKQGGAEAPIKADTSAEQSGIDVEE